MEKIKKIFVTIGDTLAVILAILFGIGMDCLMVWGEMIALAVIGLFNILFRIDMIDNLVSWVNNHMLYACIILMVINAMIFILGEIWGDSDSLLVGSSSENHSRSSYKEKSFGEYYEDELRSIREKEQLEELKKINSKLS